MRKRTTLLLLSITILLSAQQKQVIDLWPKETAPKDLVSTVKVEQEKDNEPNLTVYLPGKPNGKAVIMCPGGGYSHLAIHHEGHDMADWFNSQGIAYFVLKYRLPYGNHTLPLMDAERAIEIVRTNAKEWNINPNQIGVMGASAGGHLASTLATHYKSKATRPDFQVLLYPVITMKEGHTHQGSRNSLLGVNPSEEMKYYFSSEKQVTEDTPPAFIALSSDDKGVLPINSLSYYESLIQHSVAVALFSYPIGGHGWGFRDSFVYKREWTQELEKWLREL